MQETKAYNKIRSGAISGSLYFICVLKPIHNISTFCLLKSNWRPPSPSGSCLCIENDITGEIGYVSIYSMPAQYPFLFGLCV